MVLYLRRLVLNLKNGSKQKVAWPQLLLRELVRVVVLVCWSPSWDLHQGIWIHNILVVWG